jgi:iron complex outermembrane receptor protein
MAGLAMRILLIALLLAGATARADWDGDATARSLYERGMAHFQLEEYEVAIQLWQQAYRLKPAPELLYDIAQAYHFSSEKALAFYKKFLLLEPNARNRADVERQIAVLERALKEPPAPSSLANAKVPAVAAVKVEASEPAPKMKVPAFMPSASSTAPAPKRSDRKKGWFIAGTVILVAAVAVGVGVGVTYGTKSSDPMPSFGVARGN